uniref:Uncharacterized protein n=1 Tax=Anguilla anguilla TaxID=7936 RepID=A0A0E9RC28_ANGAN
MCVEFLTLTFLFALVAIIRFYNFSQS